MHINEVLNRSSKFGVTCLFFILLHWPTFSLSLSLSPGWHEDMDRKMSLTSLGQDQAKFGSRNALNRRVTAILV